MGSMGRSHRRREYSKARDLQAKRLLSNIGTYVPHGGGDQPFAAPPAEPATAPAPQPSASQASPTPQKERLRTLAVRHA